MAVQSLIRHQATEMSSALKAKVKNAANLLQQRKLLQRNLRSLQQHSLSRDILAAYRNRVHALPPPEALRSVTPFMNERMRKRRCFADKDLEMVMIERERLLQLSKSRALPLNQSPLVDYPTGSVAGTSSVLMNKPRALVGNMNPREFLQKIFPSHNPHLIELVWQGCGGNLERAIEQLASGIKPASVSSTAVPAVPVTPRIAAGHHLLHNNHHQHLQQYVAQQSQRQSLHHHQHQQQQMFVQAAGMLELTAQGGVPVNPGSLSHRHPSSAKNPRMGVWPHHQICALPFSLIPSIHPAVFQPHSKTGNHPAVGASYPQDSNSSSFRSPPSSQQRLNPWIDNCKKQQSGFSSEMTVTKTSAFKSLAVSKTSKESNSVNAKDEQGMLVKVGTSVSPVSDSPLSPHSLHAQTPSALSEQSSYSEESSDGVPMMTQSCNNVLTKDRDCHDRTPVVKTRLKFSVESIIGNA